jgi:hypothetical protein
VNVLIGTGKRGGTDGSDPSVVGGLRRGLPMAGHALFAQDAAVLRILVLTFMN